MATNAQGGTNIDSTRDFYNLASVVLHVVVFLALIIGQIAFAGLVQIIDGLLGLASGLFRIRRYTLRYQIHNGAWNLGWIVVGLWMVTGAAPTLVAVIAAVHALILVLGYLALQASPMQRDTATLRLWKKGYLKDSFVDPIGSADR